MTSSYSVCSVSSQVCIVYLCTDAVSGEVKCTSGILNFSLVRK